MIAPNYWNNCLQFYQLVYIYSLVKVVHCIYLDFIHVLQIEKERKAAQILAKSIKSKKGVTLSLQELHRGIDKVQGELGCYFHIILRGHLK